MEQIGNDNSHEVYDAIVKVMRPQLSQKTTILLVKCEQHP